VFLSNEKGNTDQSKGRRSGHRYLHTVELGAQVVGLVAEVERLSEGWLTAHSLHDPTMQAHLNQAKPDGWQWEPTLLTISAEDVQAHTGLAMRAQFLRHMGPRKAMSLARLVGEEHRLSHNPQRRGFLKKATVALGGVAAVLSVPSGVGHAAPPEDLPAGRGGRHLPEIRDWSPAAHRMAPA
jgi:hypothetical protein